MNLVKDRVSTRRRFFSIHLRHASRFAGPLLAATAVLVPAPVPADGLERGYAVADDSRSRSESPPAPAVAGSAEWLLVKEALSPDPEGGRVMAFDSARGRAVLFGGRTPDTWEWDGTSWFRRTPVASPAFREGPGMAYDAARGRAVLFGGYVWGGGAVPDTYFSDTWEWDGKTWVERMPEATPPARSSPAMAYDGARERVVFFGGRSSGGDLFDTWEWDGNTWVERTPTTGPSPRARGSAMAYDGARERVVLFGGVGDSGLLADTWEWDGTAWLLITPETSPPARSGHSMAYDSARQRVVLFGGSDTADTWEWDGTAWVLMTPATSPPARSGPSMAYDSLRSRVVIFGGAIRSPGWGTFADTWEWDGNSWADRSPAPASPARWEHAMAYDSSRRRTVLFGGCCDGAAGRADTWEWDGTAWLLITPATSPPKRVHHAMAYDSARRRVVLFGGRDWLFEGPNFRDTWEWDGTRWIQRTPATRPPGLDGPEMVFDGARQRIVLFGPSSIAETWEWDGNKWIQRTPPTSPLPRHHFAMAYDSARGRVVLFGGYTTSTPWVLADTWEWDGNQWIEMATSAGPRVRDGHVMAFDSARGRLVLFGGSGRDVFGNHVSLSDTWEWDGHTWVETTPITSPSPRAYSAMAYDDTRGRVVLFGGVGGPGERDNWEYGVIAGCGHATEAIHFFPGAGTESTSGQDALGVPDGQAVSLGTAGTLALRMEPPIESGQGTDFIVYEKGARSGDVNELFRVEASEDGDTYVFVGDCPGDACHLDLTQTGLTHAHFVKITDLPPQEDGASPPHLGADIDALTAVHCGPCAGTDSDDDGWGDACDNCLLVASPDQTDSDVDGYGNACDPCPLDASNDADGDGVCRNVDNCPALANADQADADADGIGDQCDNCPSLANGDQADFDADGWGDLCETGILVADANHSGRADGFDLGMVGIAFGSQCGESRYDPRVDLDRDCRVDGNDLAILAREWGKVVSQV